MEPLDFTPSFVVSFFATFVLQHKSQRSFREDLVKWIICNNQPFTVVESEFLHCLLVSNINYPTATIPSADTIKVDVMQMFEKERLQVRDMLQVNIT